jgi:hypothetical protein
MGYRNGLVNSTMQLKAQQQQAGTAKGLCGSSGGDEHANANEAGTAGYGSPFSF